MCVPVYMVTLETGICDGDMEVIPHPHIHIEYSVTCLYGLCDGDMPTSPYPYRAQCILDDGSSGVDGDVEMVVVREESLYMASATK